MDKLKTDFAGLCLKNPIIVSSSGLTDSPAKNQKLAEAGAGAIVLKSLFEEQILLEAKKMSTNEFLDGNDYLADYLGAHKLNEYISLIRDSKQVCDIPIIASINCYTDAEWIGYAKQIEAAGADAIEINILALQTSREYRYGSFEQSHIDILRHVKSVVNIPIIMKLGENITNPVALIDQLYANGAAAVVLFNRFYQPDIDIDKLTFVPGHVFSNEAQLSTPLRWVAISSSIVDKIDYAISGGVHSPDAVVKSILAGASAVEICSVIYENSSEVISDMTQFLSSWMDKNGYHSISQFRGKMNAHEINGITSWERSQFMKYFGSK